MDARLTEISLSEALRYVGVRGPADETLMADMQRCAEKLREMARPRACWRLFPLREDGLLEGTALRLEGADIREFLSGADQVILMAATLGAEAETLLQRSQRQNMADAILLDALASAAIENVCDNLCEDLAREFFPRQLTSRFSPGYGDFPLEQQGMLCAVLNVNRALGITLTPGGLMIPQKSVTAVIGVSEEPGKRLAGCATCQQADQCQYCRLK
ncbi:MAG: hypothetical protein IJ188_05075 [Clostridia bacterium]|nr:hypothetical protein [Clostridia bacterium]